MKDMAKVASYIYVVLEDQQAAYQETVVKVEGRIAIQSISILIDIGSTHIYVNPRIFESCCLEIKKHAKS